MPVDFKKQFKEFYLPPATPGIVTVPAANFLCVRGAGDPNEEDGAYAHALKLLYGVAYTIKMSPKAGHAIDGYFEYVVPPLEGFWWIDGLASMDVARKADLSWMSCIRLPDFASRDVFGWAIEQATRKKKMDFSPVEYLTLDEGVCVQCMHVGPYDAEPATTAAMDAYAVEKGYVLDFSDVRHHHEIYLGDPRRTAPEKLRTVIRHPIRKV